MRLVLLFSYLVLSVRTSKILGVFPACGYSQFILAEELMKEVANRGHEVTVISPYQPENPPANYRTILTKEALELNGVDPYGISKADLFTDIRRTYLFGNALTEYTLKNEGVQKLLRSDEHFDLVIVEQFFFDDALKGFAAHFRAPLVMFSSMGLTEWNAQSMGNLFLPSMNAVTFSSFANRMTLVQRVWNLIGTLYSYLYRHYVIYPIQKEYLKKYFPKPMEFDEVIANVSLMLLSSHVTSCESSLLPYNMVEIGGFHVVQNRLSHDIQGLLDGAEEGAILFSLGSNVKSADLNRDTIEAIFAVLGKLKQTVLWKFEKDLPNKPKNVHISKWLNQRDILAHPNIKLFITHGGLLSTIEAIYHGVPMVGIPVFGDQRLNAARARGNGIATVIPFPELSESKLDLAVNEVLNNPEYHRNAKKMSSLMRDRPVKPLDLAMYWIEHTIRHRGTRFELASSKLKWYEVYMLDILALVVVSTLVVIILSKYASFLARKLCQCKKKIKTKQQ